MEKVFLQKMKIGFDISQTAFEGGVPSYTNNLASELQKIKDLDMVYFYSSLRKSYNGKLRGVKSWLLPPTISEFLFNKLRIFPIENFIGNVDVFHSSDWTQPKTRAKKVTTYHDVVPLKYPEWSHPRIVEVHKRRLELVEQEIDMVIAVSEATKRDLLQISKIPEEKITVIYEAAGEEFKPQSEKDIEEFKKEMTLPSEFVLAIGGIGTRKNMDKVKEAAEGQNLVILGETISHIPSKELPLLYAAAKVLLYPSFYEGFGLPILEAMAVGTPVITSNVSSMPEVGGNAAQYVNPEKMEDIKKKLNLVLGDEKLRQEMIKAGLKQASKFSWKKTAAETFEVYRKLLG